MQARKRRRIMAIKNRYEFSFFFDVENGNPNGDPDMDNAPRTDLDTGLGLVTGECLKRKVRNYIALTKGGEKGYGIYISSDNGCLNDADRAALVQDGLVKEDEKADKALAELKKKDPRKASQMVIEAACKAYYDVRAFGAVMTTYQTVGAAQIRGPIQLGFARSIDPVTIQHIAITRCVFATQKEADEKSGQGTMGRRYIVPYGLYRLDGYVSAALTEKYSKLSDAGLSDADLELFWEALMNMFEYDRSAARGHMTAQKLVIFKHNSKMGNAPAHKLFQLVTAQRRDGVCFPRSFEDYNFKIDFEGVPSGVEIEIRE